MNYKVIDAQYVLDHLGELPIVDVRPTFMYEESRIPGAISIPLLDAKDAEGETSEVLAQWFADKGFNRNDVFMVYCHDGILAHEACDFLEMQGYDGQQCYEGSWLDWITDPSRPIEE